MRHAQIERYGHYRNKKHKQGKHKHQNDGRLRPSSHVSVCGLYLDIRLLMRTALAILVGLDERGGRFARRLLEIYPLARSLLTRHHPVDERDAHNYEEDDYRN